MLNKCSFRNMYLKQHNERNVKKERKIQWIKQQENERYYYE